MMSVFEDGTTLGLYRDRERTVAEIAKFSAKDAEAYRELSRPGRGLDADAHRRRSTRRRLRWAPPTP